MTTQSANVRGQLLLEARRQFGLTQKEMASKCCVSYSTYQRAETSGSVSLSTVKIIAKNASLEFKELIDLNENVEADLAPNSQATQIQLHCPHCHTPFNYGQTKCTGCLGDIHQGATAEEIKSWALGGGVVGSMATVIICDKLFSISPSLGTLISCFVGGAILSVAALMYLSWNDIRVFVQRLPI